MRKECLMKPPNMVLSKLTFPGERSLYWIIILILFLEKAKELEIRTVLYTNGIAISSE